MPVLQLLHVGRGIVDEFSLARSGLVLTDTRKALEVQATSKEAKKKDYS